MQDNYWEEQLTSNMRRVLTPVQPSDSFKSHLRTNLQLAGQQQAQRRAARHRRSPSTNIWVLGAAALGVTVAAGSVIAWAIRSRGLPHL